MGGAAGISAGQPGAHGNREERKGGGVIPNPEEPGPCRFPSPPCAPTRAPRPVHQELGNPASLEGVAKGFFNKNILARGCVLHCAQPLWAVVPPCPWGVPCSCCHPSEAVPALPWCGAGCRYRTAALLGCKGCLPHLKETQTHLVPIPWFLALIWGQLCRAETTSCSGCSFPSLAVFVERMDCGWGELYGPSFAGCSPSPALTMDVLPAFRAQCCHFCAFLGILLEEHPTAQFGSGI